MADNGRKLNELRVCDLKAELDKRKLEIVGTKATLLERLEKALKDEGLEPTKHIFETNCDRRRSYDTTIKNNQGQVCDVAIKEEPMDTVEDDNEASHDGNGDYEIDQVGDVDDECYIIENQINVEDAVKSGEENTSDGDPLKHTNNDVDTDANNQENEESINLTIGEEEQKLLHDEAPDDKEKSAEGNVDLIKPLIIASKEKDKPERSRSSKKDEKQSSVGAKPGSNSKIIEKGKDVLFGSRMKDKAEKASKETNEASEVKLPSTKTAQKDGKEKASTNNATRTSTALTTGNAGGSTSAHSGTIAAVTKSILSSCARNVPHSRNLWVSGLAAVTRASDLKTIFSKFGKVIGAKVVTNTRTPGHRCYGYVTMSSSVDASRCIEHLHRTEMHGRIISVERTKNEIGSSSNAVVAPTSSTKEIAKHDFNRREEEKTKPSATSKDGQEMRHRDEKHKVTAVSDNQTHRREDVRSSTNRKRNQSEKDENRKSVKDVNQKLGRTRSHNNSLAKLNRRVNTGERDQRQRDLEREQRERVRQREILTYKKIRDERERQRLRERERELREEERRRRDIRERQRQEEARLAEERRKLAQERERLEREKAELLRLERERQKLEREKLELERLELKRQQMKIIQNRDDSLKTARHGKRSSTDHYADSSERKRAPVETRFDVPPPPRFDATLVSSRGSKRDDFVSSSSSNPKRQSAHNYTTPSSKSRSSGDYPIREDYRVNVTVGSSKRSAIDDFPTVSSKRASGGDFIKRSTTDYVTSSKRNIDTLRDDYVSSKGSSRDAEIRHVPISSSSGGGSGSYHKSGGSGRFGTTDRGANASGYRRSGIEDLRSSNGANKRYENSSGYVGSSGGVVSGGNSNIWSGPSGGHIGHGSSSNGVQTLKSYISNGMGSTSIHGSSWQKVVSGEENSYRPVTSSHDRYDRTYNERSSGYPSSSNSFNASNARTAPDRYNAPISRY